VEYSTSQAAGLDEEPPIRMNVWVAPEWLDRNDEPPFSLNDAAMTVESTTVEAETADRVAKVPTVLQPVTRMSGISAPLLTALSKITFAEAFFSKNTHVATSPAAEFAGVPRIVTWVDPPGTGVKVHPLDPTNSQFGSLSPLGIPIPSAATTVHGAPVMLVPWEEATSTAALNAAGVPLPTELEPWELKTPAKTSTATTTTAATTMTTTQVQYRFGGGG
jgi:hypothetical protein